MANKSHIVSSYTSDGKKCTTRRLRYRENGRKPGITLGKVSLKTARLFQRYFDQLMEYKAIGASVPPSLIEEANRLEDNIRRQLVEKGFLPSGFAGSFLHWIDEYIASRKNIKDITRNSLLVERRRCEIFFGEMKLTEVTELKAEQYREFLQTEGNLETKGKGLSPAAVNRCCGYMKQFMNAAVKQRLIALNPFADIESKNLTNKSKVRTISVEMFEAAMKHIKCEKLRLVFALGRYGGVRIPSEVANMKWSDIKLGSNDAEDPGYIMIENVKTKHHSTVEEYRKAPMYPELVPYVQDAYDKAKEGDVYITEGHKRFIGRRRDTANINIRDDFQNALKAAGYDKVPDPMKNLRKTRQTELTDNFPIHVVCAWMGNSERVANDHYLHVNEGHMVSGAMIPTAKKASPKASPDSALITPHTPSEETQTLKKKGLALTVPHDTSVEVSRSSMRDYQQSAFESMKQGVFRIVKNGASPKASPSQTLSQITGRLIERWDEMSEEEKLAIQVIIDWEEVMQSITPASEESPNV